MRCGVVLGSVLAVAAILLSSPAEASSVQKTRHRLQKVVVDAGHGGSDAGAISPYGPREKDVTLDVARRVKNGLESRGFQVEMTRDSDVFIALEERTRLANRAGADLFISVHANASPSPSLGGFEVYTLSEGTDDSQPALSRPGGSMLDTVLWDLRETENRRESLRLAHGMAGVVAREGVVSVQRVRAANFYVLKWTRMPAVLIETGYLTHRADERALRSVIHKKRLAEAIVNGLWLFKTEYESTDGFTR